jgi:hypothetical protein
MSGQAARKHRRKRVKKTIGGGLTGFNYLKKEETGGIGQDPTAAADKRTHSKAT